MKILEVPLVWNKLIRRTLPDQNLLELQRLEDPVRTRKRKLVTLIQILKMMKEQKACELDLLNLICERYPSRPGDSGVVTLGCPSNQTKQVSPLGFLLLEAVEAALGSTEQRIERIHIDNDSHCDTLLEDQNNFNIC